MSPNHSDIHPGDKEWKKVVDGIYKGYGKWNKYITLVKGWFNKSSFSYEIS